MTQIGTIIIIIAVLFVCVVAITVMQKREQERARIRRQIARCKYRANEAGDILHNFSKLPIGHETRLILMQYMKANYLMAQALAPDDAVINNNLATIEVALTNPPSSVDSQPLHISQDMAQTTALVAKLNKLAKYILKIRNLKGIDPALISPSINRLMSLITEAKICAYIQQGKHALGSNEQITAQRLFGFAKGMLDKVSNKNDRLKMLEQELNELMSASEREVNEKDVVASKQSESKKEPEADSEQETQDEIPLDTIFGPRKKW
jgi:hypothetical protein